MTQTRASGILLHPTSLPGKFGIGELGDEAYRFADFLYSTGQRRWQMLPLGPTATMFYNSPYQSPSVFAGNPLLISLEKLVRDGFLETDDLEAAPAFTASAVNYEAVTQFKLPLLRKSCQMFQNRASRAERKQFDAFCEQHSFWLDDYALFMALKEAHGFAAWNTWENDIKWREPQAMKGWQRKLEQDIYCHRFQQYQFFQQWDELKRYCHDRDILLIGDIPIFVAYDSAEVWARPELFYLDGEGKPTVVAGVPPDYFSSTGQLWGNPLYRWDIMAEQGYSWWIERLRAVRLQVDIIRLDHFRGFETYWEVPAAEATAVNGRWMPGPGAALFEAAQQKLGQLPLIAEDLGMITQEVIALRDRLGFPGIRVLQFAFGDDCADNIHRPHTYPRNCVAYTGTHDNNTTVGWFKGDDIGATTQTAEERQRERQRALEYLGTDGREIHWGFIRAVFQSAADTAIVPLQDVLGLGSEARMNIPGRAGGNWRWRFAADMLTDEIKARLQEVTRCYGR